MLPKKYQKGFIDPLSLFAIGFLLVSLIVGTKVATDRQRSLDIREKAAVDIEDGGGGGSCIANGKCVGPGEDCCGGSYFDNSCYLTETRCGTKSAPTPKPTLKPTSAPSGCITNGKCVGPGEDCCGGSYFDNSCYLTETRCGTKPTPSPTLTPSCILDGKCVGPGEDCCSGKDYYDYSCHLTETRCGIKSLPTPKPTLKPTSTPSPSCISNGKCVGPGEDCCSGGYFDNSCYLTETRCGTKPSPTSTPSPTLPTPTPSSSLKGIGYFCTSNNECASGYCTYGPGGDKWCQEKPLDDPVPYCTTHMAQVCTYGCSPNIYGGFCKSAPAIIEEENVALKADGEICTTSSECQSGKCQYASFGLNKCITVFTEKEQLQQEDTEHNQYLTPMQKAQLALTQTALDAITTFNKTRVATHVQNEAEQISNDALVIHEAILGEDLGGNRTVNAGIAAYATIDIASSLLTFGGASIDDVRIASMNWAQTNAEANTRDASWADPERLLSALNAGLTSTALVTAGAGVAGFTPNQAAAQLYNNPTYQQYLGQYTGRAYSYVNNAISAADDFLGIGNRSAPIGTTDDLIFNISEQRVQTGTIDSPTQPVEIKQVSERVVEINTGDQFIKIDLDDTILRDQVDDALRHLSEIPDDQFNKALWEYTTDFGNTSGYDALHAQAIERGNPLSLSDLIKSGETVCLERGCFRTLVKQSAGRDPGVLDIFVPGEGVGHLTTSSSTIDPLTRLQDFAGSPLFNTEGVDLIQRVNLFEVLNP